MPSRNSESLPFFPRQAAELLLHTHRVSPPAPCRRRFGRSSAQSWLLWPLLTSLHPSRSVAVAVVWFAQTNAETSQGKSCLFPSVPARFTHAAFRMTIGSPHPLLSYPTVWTSYPVSVRRVRVLPSCLLTGRFLQTPPRDGPPLFRLVVPAISAHRGLSPPRYTTCPVHNERHHS
jgi:hypothetical protein